MKPPGFWGQAGWVIRKDLQVEWKGGETLWMAIPFMVLALLLAPLAIGTDHALLSRTGPGILWLVILLFGMTVTLRPSTTSTRPVRDLMTLSGLDPGAAFLGGGLASTILLFSLIVVLTPVMIVLYGPEGRPEWGSLVALAGAGSLALGLLGTLIRSLVTGLRARTSLGPLLAIPPALPVLLATTRGTELAISQRSSITWLLVLVAMDLALMAVGLLLAGRLHDTIG